MVSVLTTYLTHTYLLTYYIRAYLIRTYLTYLLHTYFIRTYRTYLGSHPEQIAWVLCGAIGQAGMEAVFEVIPF
jgi:hypothetical protein